MRGVLLSSIASGAFLITSVMTTHAMVQVKHRVRQAPPPQLTTVHFLNLRDAWGLSGTRVYRTQNGGDSWRDVTPAGLRFPSSIQTMAATTASVVGQLQSNHSEIRYEDFMSKDGGTHWWLLDMPPITPYAPGMQWLSQKVGWLWGLTDKGTEMSLFKTSSGGTRWNSVPFDFTRFNGSNTDFYFMNGSKGWMTGMSNATGQFFLFETSDGGKMWNKRVLPMPGKGFFVTYSPSFLNRSSGVMPMMYNNQFLYFYRTNNGGVSWRLGAALPITPSYKPVYEQIGHTIMTAIQKNGKADLYASTDLGATWSSVPTSPHFRSIEEIDLLTPSNGFLLSKFRLWETSNGGKKWRIVPGDSVHLSEY